MWPSAGSGGGCDRNSLKAGLLPAYRRGRPARLQDGSRRGALPELAFSGKVSRRAMSSKGAGGQREFDS